MTGVMTNPPSLSGSKINAFGFASNVTHKHTVRMFNAQGRVCVHALQEAAESYFMCMKVVSFLLQYKCLCIKYKMQAFKSHRLAFFFICLKMINKALYFQLKLPGSKLKIQGTFELQ